MSEETSSVRVPSPTPSRPNRQAKPFDLVKWFKGLFTVCHLIIAAVNFTFISMRFWAVKRDKGELDNYLDLSSIVISLVLYAPIHAVRKHCRSRKKLHWLFEVSLLNCMTRSKVSEQDPIPLAHYAIGMGRSGPATEVSVHENIIQAMTTAIDVSEVVQPEQNLRRRRRDSHGPVIKLSSELDAINQQTGTRSVTYQYACAARKTVLSLFDVFTEESLIDGELGNLIRAMADVLAFTTARSTSEWTMGRLLQQTIECCLFINEYSRKRFEEPNLGTSDVRKMVEFSSFFSAFKEALESGTDILPEFISSRAREAIDESVLRQRLSPSETDTKYHRPCLLGTRVEAQEQIIEWALSVLSPNILWLNGVAGSGKSTVIATVAEYFRSIYRLGAFIRFERGASDPSSVISTIAFKLSLFDSTIGNLVLAETNRDEDITEASLFTQFEKLLEVPLCTAAEAQQGPVIVVLDALDECGTPATRRTLIQVLLRGFRRLPSSFKLIVTSRRERDIDKVFSSQSDLVYSFELDYTSKVSRSDVEQYMEYEIRRILGSEDDALDDASMRKYLHLLWRNAAGLFIWASTIVKLIEMSDSPSQKLKELASSPRSPGSLDQLYTTVLRSSGISWRDDTSRTRFQRVIGLILLSKVPLTESTIDAIMGPSVGNCRLTLSRLRSVIGYLPGELIRLSHASFSDFLMSSSDTEDWFIDIPAQESFLAMRCFEIMEAELRFNICDLKTSFILNDAVDDIEDRIESRISTHFSYACRFWSHHLCNISYGSALMQQLSAFLHSRLLYWLEVLSLLASINIAGPALLGTIRWIENNDAEVVAFVRDARRLISIFALPISQSAPHVYLSMLPLMADESRVSTHYLQHASSLVRVTRRGVKRQSPLLKLLEGHTAAVGSVDFSPDGSLIVSGSRDKTVRIWDTERGELTAGPFAGHVGHIHSISFSPDGTRIVVGGDNGIAVLDVDSGNIVAGPFGDKRTWSVSVSPGGKHIVSASSNVIKMWDLESGMIVGEPFVGHTEEVRCVAHSHDGRFIVSCSEDKSVRVWGVESRRLVRKPFVGHTRQVNSVAFSPDGKLVVSGSDDDIRIWDLEKEEVVYRLNEGANSVAYSSDGTRIVSGSYDKTVRIWNAQNGQGPFEHPEQVNCVTFSPDGTRVVSGSIDKNLRIWDAEIGRIDFDSGPKRVRVDVVRFSSDGTCVISDDGTTWRIEDGMVIPAKVSNKLEYQTLAITDSMQFEFEGYFSWNPFTREGSAGPYPIWHLAVSPNRKRFAFGSANGTIKVWDKERDMLVCGPFNGQGGRIWSLTFSPDGRHIASGSKDIRIWAAETGELLFGPFTGDTSRVYSISYSPDGRHIASCSRENKTVTVWDIETGRFEGFEGHAKGVRSVVYSPDGSLLVSVCDEGSEIRVWNTGASGPLIQSVQDLRRKSDLPKWTLDKDGWIRGAHDELLLWVPLDFRPTLFRYENTAVLNVEFSIALDFSGSAQGERWHECFHPAV